MGITERPSTTEISPLTLSTLEAMHPTLTLSKAPPACRNIVSESLILDASLKTQVECPVEWKTSDHAVPYPEALAEMEARAAAIAEGTAGELVWLLEHPPIYTAGTSA